MATLLEMLQTSAWGRSLTPNEFAHVARVPFERNVPEGCFVARMGEPVTHWMGVIDGLVKMSVVSADGKVSTLAGINVGGWFGEGSLVKKEPRRYDVIALRPSRVAMMPHATFEWLLATSMPFCHYLIHMMNPRMSVFIGMLEYGRLLGQRLRDQLGDACRLIAISCSSHCPESVMNGAAGFAAHLFKPARVAAVLALIER